MIRPKLTNLYARAGIDDVGAFYRTLFASNELMRADYFDAPNQYDLRWTKTLWVYDNVRSYRPATNSMPLPVREKSAILVKCADLKNSYLLHV